MQERIDEEYILDYIYESLQADQDNHPLTGVEWFGIVPGTEGRERSMMYLNFDGRCYRVMVEAHPHDN